MLEKLRKPTIIAGIIGAIKLATDTFGYSIISDNDVNAIANGVAAVAAIIAALLNRNAPKTE